MSEYIKSDVGEYFTNRTMNFEKSPPDIVWNNIEKAIPNYSASGAINTLVKLVIGTMSLSVIIFVVLWIKHVNFSETESKKGLVVNQKSSSLIQTKMVEALVQNTQTTEQINPNQITSENVNPNTVNNNVPNTTNVGQVEKLEKTYSINASGLRGVYEISFVDENKNVVLSSKNPTPNGFGFYVIDISKLAGGTYSIMITTSEGTKLHKKETFK